jgi:hypothetical protein
MLIAVDAALWFLLWAKIDLTLLRVIEMSWSATLAMMMITFLSYGTPHFPGITLLALIQFGVFWGMDTL